MSPSLNHGHVKGNEPLERGASQTLLKQTDKEPFINLKLSKVPAVCLQMRNGTTSTIVFIEFWDVKLRRVCGLGKETEVVKLVRLVVLALH